MKKIIYNRLQCYLLAIYAIAALSIAGITARAQAYIPTPYEQVVLNDNPLAFYPLTTDVDPSDSSAAHDITANHNDGQYSGGAGNINSGSGPSVYITGGGSFNGTTFFIDLSTGPNASILNFGGTITMEAWVQPAASGQLKQWGNILAKGADSSNNEMWLRLNQGSKLYEGGIYNPSLQVVSALAGPATASWTHVVSTYDGTAWDLYINGVLANKTINTNGPLNFATAWAIGNGTGSGNTRFFTGNISEVALYTNALTPVQVAEHYYAGLNGPIPNNSTPIIYSQPASQTVFVGSSIQLQVAAVGSAVAPITSYQWYFNTNVLLSDQTNATLTLTNFNSSNVGYYNVAVANANGTMNSVAASLNISTSSITIFGSDFDNDAGQGNLSNAAGGSAYAGNYPNVKGTGGVFLNIGVSNTAAASITGDLSSIPADYSGVSYLGVRHITSYSAPISPIVPTADLSGFVLSFDMRVSGLLPNLAKTPVDIYNLSFNSGGTPVFNFSSQYTGFLSVGSNFVHFSIPLSQISPGIGGAGGSPQPVSAFANPAAVASIDGFTLDFLESAWNFNTTNPVTIVVDNVQLVENPPGGAPMPVAPITWSAPTMIANDMDVLTVGTSVSAYDWSGSTTLNGVTFGSVDYNIAIGVISGRGGPYPDVFGSSSAPFADLSENYKKVLSSANIAYDDNTTFEYTLNNLTVGKVYAVQVWSSDARSLAATRITTINGSGNTAVLHLNVQGAEGGVGQYTIGTFTAASTIQTFTASGSQVNALQVRDITGTGSGILSISNLGNGSVQLSWTGSGTLQTAQSLTGPWQDAEVQTSPQTVTVTGLAAFFRLR